MATIIKIEIHGFRHLLHAAVNHNYIISIFHQHYKNITRQSGLMDKSQARHYSSGALNNITLNFSIWQHQHGWGIGMAGRMQAAVR
jgi:hypothetical protein